MSIPGAPEVPAPNLQEIEDSLSIAQMCQNVLDLVVSGYENLGLPLPDRRFIIAGTPAHDCEQVVVVFRQVYIGPPGDEAATPQRCEGPRSALIEVHIIRKIPTPTGTRQTTPSVEAIIASATTQMQDAWLLLQLAPGLDTWNGMGAGGPGVIATAEVGEPQGAMQATVLNLTMQVP